MSELANKLKGQTGGRRRKTGRKVKKSRKNRSNKNKSNKNKNMRRGGMGDVLKKKE